jgi:hypothetical protein
MLQTFCLIACLRTEPHSVAWADLELVILLVPRVLGLPTCTTVPSIFQRFFFSGMLVRQVLYHLSHSASPFFLSFWLGMFLEIGSHKLFVWAGFEL